VWGLCIKWTRDCLLTVSCSVVTAWSLLALCNSNSNSNISVRCWRQSGWCEKASWNRNLDYSKQQFDTRCVSAHLQLFRDRVLCCRRFWHATQDCVVPYVDIILHRGRFWAKSAASGSVRWCCFRSCWTVLNHVMRGRPSCLLQSAGGEVNRILLASALSSMRIICPNRVSRRDWIIAVSLGCYVNVLNNNSNNNN